MAFDSHTQSAAAAGASTDARPGPGPARQALVAARWGTRHDLDGRSPGCCTGGTGKAPGATELTYFARR
jgi:hypothetical protein